jgi:DNA-binding LacI/PurR family transcriptional regulator
MKQHIASISDIAKALGIAPSTVSRALNNHPDIGADTRERVHSYAKKVNYRPNALALSLKNQRSSTIGIVVPEIVHHFFSSIIGGIEDIAYAKGYRLMICQSKEEFEREKINIQGLIDHRVAGIMVSMSKNTKNFDHFKDAIAQGLPLLFFDRNCKQINTDTVLTDDYGGAYLVTNHLISKGKRRIMHLSAPQHLLIASERLLGYTDALINNGIEPDHRLVLHCDTQEMVIAKKDEILKLLPNVDAIFAVNDITAIAIIKFLQEMGLKVPENISVAGFGDDPISLVARPQLTTVEQKGYDMGCEAATILINRIENPDLKIEPIMVKFEASLRARESS